jgi:hypothetical protein
LPNPDETCGSLGLTRIPHTMLKRYTLAHCVSDEQFGMNQNLHLMKFPTGMKKSWYYMPCIWIRLIQSDCMELFSKENYFGVFKKQLDANDNSMRVKDSMLLVTRNKMTGN